MMNMKPGFLFASLSFASLLAFAQAASAEQPAPDQQFSVTVAGIEKPMIWDGKTDFRTSALPNFRTGALPSAAEVAIRPGQTVDGRSELFVDANLMVLQTYTTGSGETKQSIQIPEEASIKQACHIAVGEECVVKARGTVAARVTRTR